MTGVRPSVRYQLLMTLLGATMLYLLLSSLAGFWRVTTDPATLLGFSVTAAAFGWVWWRSPRGGLLLAAVATAAALAAGAYIPAWDRYLHALWRHAGEYALSLQLYQWNATFHQSLGIAFLALTALAGGPVILGEALSRGTAFRSIAAGAAVFGTEWTWFYDRSADFFMSYLLLAFAVWALGQAGRRDARWVQDGRRFAYRSGVTAPVVAVLITALLATALPSNVQPMDLGALGEKAQTLFPFLAQLRGSPVSNGGRFSLASTGFTTNLGALGGPVALDDSLALELVLPAPLEETAYLRGTTFRVYNGRTWFAGDPEKIQLPADGLLPSYLGSDVLRQQLTFAVRPAISFGRTLFTFLEPMRVDGYAYRADADGNLLAEQGVAPGSAYIVASRVPIYSAEQIRTLSTGGQPDQYEPYLQVPESLPTRVRDLAFQITSRSAHPYDKAVALESWLRGLPYDLDVPPLPAGRDFVDHFLFDLERGYCTYYSSAMAVMLRDLGIPARLVEGFAVPASLEGTREPDGGLVIPVRNSMAHAWVEAYFPSYGWVTFDPTPRADLPLIDRSTPAPATAEEERAESPSSPSAANSATPNLAEIPPEMEELNDPFAASTAEERRFPWAPLALAALLLLIWAGYRRLRQQDRLPAGEAAQVVQQAWLKTDRLMGLFGAGRRPSETHREYAASLGKRYPSLEEPAQATALDFEEARYAPPGHPVAPEAELRARTFWHTVREAALHRFGWRRYLWRRLGIRWPWRRGPG